MHRPASIILASVALIALASAAWADDCAPSKVTITATTGKTTCVLNFNDPGDDCATGTAASYEVRRSNSTITDTNWQSAPVVATGVPVGSAGASDCAWITGLTCNQSYNYVVFFFDAAGNRSPISNNLVATQKSCSSHSEVACP